MTHRQPQRYRHVPCVASLRLERRHRAQRRKLKYPGGYATLKYP